MLGNGCPWRDYCRAYNDKYNKRTYCDTTSTWENCPHRPKNEGNKEVERNYNYRKGNDSTAALFWKIVIGMGILWFVVEHVL